MFLVNQSLTDLYPHRQLWSLVTYLITLDISDLDTLEKETASVSHECHNVEVPGIDAEMQEEREDEVFDDNSQTEVEQDLIQKQELEER